MYYTVDNWTGSESEEIEIAGKYLIPILSFE